MYSPSTVTALALGLAVLVQAQDTIEDSSNEPWESHLGAVDDAADVAESTLAGDDAATSADTEAASDDTVAVQGPDTDAAASTDGQDASVTSAAPGQDEVSVAPASDAAPAETNGAETNAVPAGIEEAEAAEIHTMPLSTSFTPMNPAKATINQVGAGMTPETYNPNGGMGIYQLNNGVNVHAAALAFQDPVIASGHLSAGAWAGVAVGLATIVSAVALLTLLVRHRRRQARRLDAMVDEGTALLTEDKVSGNEKVALDLETATDGGRLIVDSAVPSLLATKETARPAYDEDVDEPDFLWSQAAALQAPVIRLSQKECLEGELGQFV